LPAKKCEFVHRPRKKPCANLALPEIASINQTFQKRTFRRVLVAVATGNKGAAVISADRAKELGLTDFLNALASGDHAAAGSAIRALNIAASTRLGSSGTDTDPDWFERVTNLLMRIDARPAPDDLAECLLSCAQWFQKDGKSPLGIAAAEKAVAVAEEATNFSLLRRAYNTLGNLHNSTRDYVQATVCYARAVEIARSIVDKAGECASIANLAVARLNSGLLEECRTLNALVIDMAKSLEKENSKMLRIKQQAYHNVALASLMLGDLFIARTNIENAIGRGPDPVTQYEAFSRVLSEYTYVKILSKSSEYELARERSLIARSYASMARSKLAELQATLAECACDVNEGKFDIALSRLHKLSVEAKTNEAMRRDVLEAMVLAHDKAGNHAEARRLHREYLNALAQAQRKGARQQLDALKKSFATLRVGDRDSSVLPESVLAKLRDRDELLWKEFRSRLEALAVLAELRDDATGEHAFRVGKLSALFARALGLSHEKVETIESAARLHDIGKLVVPDIVLQKRGKLVEAELEIMRSHAAEGANILLEVQHEAFRPAAEIALCHHEWWNGKGYPRGLSADQIPESARITALADVFDALSHRRPYKPAWSFDRCVNVIRELRGQQFEPKLCDVFLDLISDLNRQYKGELDAYLGDEARRSPMVNANKLVDHLVQEHRAVFL
jgi:putative two-component system response regulator